MWSKVVWFVLNIISFIIGLFKKTTNTGDIPIVEQPSDVKDPTEAITEVEEIFCVFDAKGNLVEEIEVPKYLYSYSDVFGGLNSTTPGISMLSVIGEDTRIEVKNTHDKPYSAVVSISSDAGRGTGAFISKKLIITAAHVIWSDSRCSKSLAIYSGRNTTADYVNFEVNTVKIIIPKLYIENPGTISNDYAFILTNNEVDYGYFIPVATDDMEYFRNKSIVNVGYPGDKRTYSMWEGHGQLTVIGGYIQHNADTYGGNSGGPILSDDYKVYYGTHTAGMENTANFGAKIKPRTYLWLKEQRYLED